MIIISFRCFTANTLVIISELDSYKNFIICNVCSFWYLDYHNSWPFLLCIVATWGTSTNPYVPVNFRTENPVSQCFIKNWKAICVLFKVALIERLSKLSVCVLSSKYLSNVKVMHVFKCIFILRYLINIIYFTFFFLFPWRYIVVLFCLCCSRHNKKKKT